VPDDTTLIRWANLIGPETVAALNDRVVELARSLKVTRGRKLRIDATVVETNIHHPTDSRILGDGVRVVSRLLRRAKTVLGEQVELGKEAFRTRTRSVRRLAQQLHRVARRKGEQAAEELRQAYDHLITIARKSRAQAASVRAALQEQATQAAQRLAEHFDQLLPLLDQAIEQATRRVLRGEPVPAEEKLLSLFEPHTQVIRRHKAGQPTEFGRKLLLDEVEGGIITRYDVLDEVGLEHPHLRASLDAHQRHFARAPDVLAGDRGPYSPENEALARQAGVKRVVLPKTGRRSRERQQHELGCSTLAIQLCQQLRQSGRYLISAVGQEQQNRLVDATPDQGKQGVQAGIVTPVQIFNHHQHRPNSRQPADKLCQRLDKLAWLVRG